MVRLQHYIAWIFIIHPPANVSFNNDDINDILTNKRTHDEYDITFHASH